MMRGYGAAAVALVFAVPAVAAPLPVQRIEAFYADVLPIMKQARSLGIQGRFKAFEPVIARSFDLPAMTKYAVGPRWAALADGERAALTTAFAGYITANYAKNFDGFDGERFVVEPLTVPRGADVIVKSRIVPATGAPTAIAYRMQMAGAAWQVTDIFYSGGISEMTLRRADFTAVLAQGGAAALIKRLETQTAGLLK